MIRRLRSKRGESIGEALVAFVVITLCVLILVGAVQVGRRNLALSTDRTDQLNLEENALDSFLRLRGIEGGDLMDTVRTDAGVYYPNESIGFGSYPVDVDLLITERYGFVAFVQAD